MNPELDKLAKEYAETKDKNILPKIFKILKHILKKKASFVFYQQTFHEGKKLPKSKWFKNINGELIPTYEHNFRLVDTKQTELEDIEQELALEVIRLLKKYNPKQPFDEYFFGTLWKWIPKFTTKNKFLNYLKHNSMYIVDDAGNEKSLIDDIPQKESFSSGLLNFIDMFENLNENEIKIINLFQENGNIKQTEIARIIGVTKQRVKQILQGLKNKYIK
jgi:RNA polymerase sigma factor (sigma-70 family)